jgi:prepilin-type N-terminal cleavage/methylation domain-containing protein
MTRTKINNETGLTLLEVMVAIVILSLSLLVLMNMTMVAMTGSDWSNKTTTATQLSQEKFEQLRASLNPQSGADTAFGMERVWTVQQAAANLYEINVAVTWADLKGQQTGDTITAFIKP